MKATRARRVCGVLEARGIIDAMPSRWVFTTVDFIRARDGTFLKDLRTSVDSSPNAGTGRFLKRNCGELGIVLLEKDIPITDDIGRRTHTARWQRQEADPG